MNSDNNSGIIWSLACLIILTLSGVFLSTLVDKKIGSSQEKKKMFEAVADDERNLASLRIELELCKSKHTAAEESSIQKTANISSKSSLSLQIESSVQDLRTRRANLKSSIQKLSEEFDEYRKRYRNKVWRDAIGERIESLLLKSGRQFDKVSITRVTPIGMEITYADGIARIDSKELSNEFIDRFQWNEEERSAALRAERDNRAQLTREVPPNPLQNLPRIDDTSDVELEKIRTQIRLLQTKQMSLKSSIQTATSENSYSSKRSVPGSLHTWAEQVSILKSEMSQTEALLALAKEKLRATYPDDLLVK